MILLNVFVRKLKTETDLLIRPARFSLKFAKHPGISRNKSRVRNGWGPVSGGGDGWGPRPDHQKNATDNWESLPNGSCMPAVGLCTIGNQFAGANVCLSKIRDWKY